MSPVLILLLLAGLGGGAYLVLHKGGTGIDRGEAMGTMAELLAKIATGKPAPVTPSERELAASLAEKVFNLPKTALGARTGKGYPSDEMWPGGGISVADYMKKFIALRGTPSPGPRVYNDQSPVPPYEDPRIVRQQALAAERAGNPIAAKVLHIKADGLNRIIGAVKSKNAAVSTGKGIASAVKSLGGLFKKG